MSIVSDFAKASAASAMPMIGQEPVVVGGLTLACVLAEASDDPEFATGGRELQQSLTAVCLTSEIGGAVLVKKAATARGQSWRVDAVTTGATFTTITLTQVTRA
jgi:hypothetical protein